MDTKECDNNKSTCDGVHPLSPPVPKFKHDWYQTDMFVVVSVLARGVQEENVKIAIYENEVTVSILQPGASEHTLTFHLSYTIIPEQSSYKIFSTKVEIKLKKRDSMRWTELEGKPKNEPKPAPAPAPAPAPQSVKESKGDEGKNSCQTKNWDRVVNELTKEEEKQEGEAALNALFQQIYGQGSDEVKRAMNKSFVESGGTVLSTNWKEVEKDKVDVKAPDGMEWRQWEQ